MKKLQRKAIALSLMLVILLSVVPAQALALDSASAAPITRETAVAALWTEAGQPAAPSCPHFSDVSADAPWADAIAWAVSEGIVCGAGDGAFAPNAPVNREQLAVLLYRYAQWEGLDVSVGEDTNILSYNDLGQWSAWAVPALQWAVGVGILEDQDGCLNAWAPVSEAVFADRLAALQRLLGTAPWPDAAFREKYTLDRMVVLSRHNIRSPLSGKGSVLGDATPHSWFNWSSGTSELSLRGGVLETMMGQYFRKYLVSAGLFEENEFPAEGEARFYANAKQRTIATARYFAAGMFPVADVDIETHVDYDTMDPVFEPRLTYTTDAYCAAALEQIAEMGGEKGLAGLGDQVLGSYGLLSQIIDLPESRAYADGALTGFAADDTQITLELYKEPGMKGSLKTATSISDALVLQYYEEPDPAKAAFGESLSRSDWCAVSAVKDYYIDVLYTAPLVAVNVANPLIREIKTELAAEGRKFTFLCGHDSNVGSVLAALGTEEYTAPKAIEGKTPIGVKLVFEVWTPNDGAGEALVSARLVYQSVEQLRDMSLLTLEQPPVSFPIRMAGLETNEDGLCTLSDLNALLDRTIAAYNDLPSVYGPMGE